MVKMYVFDWANGDGSIGTGQGETLKEAKKDLWRKLQELRHDAVMDDLKRGKKYKVTTIEINITEED